jgi:hypothetical protein
MNEELTRVFEKYELEAMIEYYKNNDCSRRVAIELAAALLAEKAKPKVWDGAPEWATNGRVHYWTNGFDKEMYSKLYTRELPKTRAREIAEEVTALVNKAIEGISVEEIEAVLTKYAEELKGEA